MTALQAIVLGLVQGITEFFPISSSAHLLLVPWLFGWHLYAGLPMQQTLDLEKTFDVALHAGTFLAVLVLMRVDIVRILRAFFGSIYRRKVETRDEKLAWLLLISTIPAGIVGVAFESFIEDTLGQPWLMAILIIGFGFVMWAADSLAPGGSRARTVSYQTDGGGGSAAVAPAPATVAVEAKTLASLRWYHALFVGVAQAAALAPGVSRSGVTLSALRGLGVTRDEAVRYAFLLTIPIIGGSALYKGLKVAAGTGLPAGSTLPFVLGILTALVSGYFAARFLLGWLRHHSLRGFVWYRFAFGVLILVLIATGVRAATIG
jgi:undecaprenyl-diphosphatase